MEDSESIFAKAFSDKSVSTCNEVPLISIPVKSDLLSNGFNVCTENPAIGFHKFHV